MSASERGGYCLSSELKRNLDGGSLAVQRLNSFDYLSADVRQMLYGFSSVSNLFNICGFSLFHGGHGGTRRGINENENDRSLEGVLCPQADGVGERELRKCP